MWGEASNERMDRSRPNTTFSNERLSNFGQATQYDQSPSAHREAMQGPRLTGAWRDFPNARTSGHHDQWQNPPTTAISIKTRLYSMKSTGNQTSYSDGDQATASHAMLWSVSKRDDITIVRDAPPNYQHNHDPYQRRHVGEVTPKSSFSSAEPDNHMQASHVRQFADNHGTVDHRIDLPSQSPFFKTHSQQLVRTGGGDMCQEQPSCLSVTQSKGHPCDPESQPLLDSGDSLFGDTKSSVDYRPAPPLEMYKLLNFMTPKHMNPKLMSKFAQAYEEYCDTEEGQAGPARKTLPYKRSWSIPGVMVFFFFLLAAAWYFYVRVVYTLDSGYPWYAKAILALEIFTSLSTLNYAFLLTRTTSITGSPGLPPAPRHFAATKDALPMPPQFHVRVLIPCYRETCDLVMKTVRAAATALLPNHTNLTVYLCDDGRDPMKEKAVQSLPNVVYVSGRERMKGEVNGKSNNLNYALNLIYQLEDTIHESEIVVVFDADMVPKSDFFVKVLEVMTRHNVALCLTPQAYHNINAGADIFNNSNLSFWEYLLPGLDAWGYIACTGTNFAIRARALADCGWFPSWTITEDYALGMKLKEKGYNGVYLKEYLAEGEAPQEIRNIFRQRSRWCKGQFQVLFSRCCPLFSHQLSMGMRLLYTGVTFCYITNFVAVLTALLVPFVALVFGYYPLVISQRFAIACTLYLAACTTLNMFCYQLAHLRSLWFASCACMLLWFTWTKAMISVPLALLRIKRKASFKATKKAGEGGASKRGCGAYLRPPNVGNLEGTKDLYVLLLVMCIALTTVGIGVYNLVVEPYTEQGSFRWYLLISVLWAAYFSITPGLFVFYCYNKGKIFEDMCTLAMYACAFITGFSLYAVWQVPEDYTFGSVLGLALQFFNAQRSGALPLQNDVPWRGDSALFDSVMLRGNNYSLSGGWYDGGDHMKHTYSIATSVSMVAWGFINFGKAFDGPVKGRALEVLKWGSDYLMKCHIPPGPGVRERQFVAVVGNLTQDRSTWIPAEAMSKFRPVALVNRTHPGADLIGSTAAALAAASVAFDNQARMYSNSLRTNAEILYHFAVQNKGYYSKSVETWGKYTSDSFNDDLALAACWLYYATHNSTYLQDCQHWRQEYINEAGNGLPVSWDYQHSFWPVEMMLYGFTGKAEYKSHMKRFLSVWMNAGGKGNSSMGVLQTKKGLAWLRPGPLQWSNNIAFLALLFAKAEPMPSVALKYGCWAHRQISYVLGDSGRSYMVGYGKQWPVRVPHRGASCPAAYLQAKGDTCSWDSGYYTSSPNPNMLWGAVVGGPDQHDMFYDERNENSPANQVSLLNNAGFVGAVAGLSDGRISVSKCEQGHGFVFDTIAAIKEAR